MADHDSKNSKTAQDETLGERAQHVFEQSRDSAREAAKRASANIDTNPLAVVVGGAALGVLAAALIPRSAREKELLAPVGKRLSETATAAVAAAKESAQAELESRGLTKDGARDQVRSLLEGLGAAASSAGTAAAGAARGKADDHGAAGD